MFEVTIYYGGEMFDETIICDSLEEAKALSLRGEHSEIIDLTNNKLIE